mmetsp:Transcript_19706/g.32522  ORF Transcript_19706/g.32522 Transcript_19706/m.32522 type:complete len:191 (+) Transcript_19706:452-1024(+)
MKFIYWLRLTVCSIIFGFKVSDQQKYREIVSFVIIFGFFIALLLCLGNYLYHQGRKIALDLISIFAPCLKGSCTRWIAQGCCCCCCREDSIQWNGSNVGLDVAVNRDVAVQCSAINSKLNSAMTTKRMKNLTFTTTVTAPEGGGLISTRGTRQSTMNSVTPTPLNNLKIVREKEVSTQSEKGENDANLGL